MIHKAQTLKAEGKPSFFCRLNELSGTDLENCLEVGTSEELQAWKESAQTGYFFLDSVDEAKLLDPQAFAWALKKFCKTLGFRVNQLEGVSLDRTNLLSFDPKYSCVAHIEASGNIHTNTL